jgi:deazaflavin-dependent oxidoreductase (nitroreductase family)
MLTGTVTVQIWQIRPVDSAGASSPRLAQELDACLVSGMISGVLWPPRAGRASADASTLAQMGLIQALAYEVPEPNTAQRAMWHVSSSRPGAWLFAKSGLHLDRFLLRLSNGQVTLATLVAGIPVITIVTTGARTGRTRATPLLGVPFAGDVAVIGTRFGQKGTPGWYYNLRADPAIQVIYRDKSTAAVAREARGEERQAIWGRARQIYGGYDAYARRIKDRQIHIMLLSMPVTSASDTG